jgi:hypothetical protein
MQMLSQYGPGSQVKRALSDKKSGVITLDAVQIRPLQFYVSPPIRSLPSVNPRRLIIFPPGAINQTQHFFSLRKHKNFIAQVSSLSFLS